MADKRGPRRGSGGSGGGGGGRGRPGGQGGSRGGRPPWSPRPPSGGGRPPSRGAPREGPPPWAAEEAPARGPGGPRRGRWQAVEVDSIAELAEALNSLRVTPDELVHLEPRVGDPELMDEGEGEGWIALVWAP